MTRNSIRNLLNKDRNSLNKIHRINEMNVEFNHFRQIAEITGLLNDGPI